MNHDTTVLFDSSFGLEQLSGNRDLLCKMLDRFCTDYANIEADLSATIAANDQTSCKAKAHTIKGVAGNLGMWNLYHHSRVLENAAKDVPENMASAFGEFQTSINATFTEIKGFIAGDSVPAATAPEASAASAPDAISELRSLLEAFEFIAPDKLDDLLTTAGFDGGVKAQVTQAINDLDYPTAISLIEA